MAKELGKGLVRVTSSPKPTAVWRIPWVHEGLGGTVREGWMELEAGYETDVTPPVGVPDRFQLRAHYEGRGGRPSLALSREAATNLYKALGEALAWQ